MAKGTKIEWADDTVNAEMGCDGCELWDPKNKVRTCYAGLQTERIARALGELGPNAHEAARRFLTAMIDADGRDGVQKLIARADRARRPKP